MSDLNSMPDGMSRKALRTHSRFSSYKNSRYPSVAASFDQVSSQIAKREVTLDPQNFTIDKILMMLTIKKIELLRREFENVIKEDREREEHL